MMYSSRTWCEVSLDHLAHNYNSLREKVGESVRFLGVVKADAYGHGAPEVSRYLENLGAEFLAVSNIDEAAQIRRSGISLPILILGYTPPEHASYEAENGIRQEVHSLEYAQKLNSVLNGSKSRLRIHLKFDTGMTRLGFSAYDSHFSETLQEIITVSNLPNLIIEGVFQHFCCADILTKECIEFTGLQYDRFCKMLRAMSDMCVKPEIRHCCNSAATIHYPEYAMDMVRPGIATYGYLPTQDMKGEIDLKPLMTLHSSVGQIRRHDPGTSVSYGRLWTSNRKSRIAVIPIGYADGLDRHLTNGLSFLIRGHHVPQVGRICMDMCMADITDYPDISEGDDAIVFSALDENVNTANRLETYATALHTIEYELLCRIGKRVPRIYCENGREVSRMESI